MATFEILLFLTFFTILCISHSVSGSECKKINDCKCRKDDGAIIDLNQTSGISNIRFQLEKGEVDSTTYYYDPCRSFKIGPSTGDDSCNNTGQGVAVCQNTTNSTFYNLGALTSSQFSVEDNHVIVTYKHNLRTTRVKLICSQLNPSESVLKVVGEKPTNVFTFLLFSQCACPDGCVSSQGSNGDSGMSTGSILLLVTFILAFVYLVGGVLFNLFIRGATGRELIPNVEFWTEFPGLVRDGVVFAMNCCKHPEQYDRI